MANPASLQSPVVIWTKHFTISFGLVALVSGAGAALIHQFGDPDAGQPLLVTPIFAPAPDVVTLNNEPRLDLVDGALALGGSEESAVEDGAGAEAATSLSAAAPTEAALARAPIAGLSIAGPFGPLPAVARDGQTPSQAYRKPATGIGAGPKIAMVIGGLGLNALNTKTAIEELPSAVTLAFAPYTNDLQNWINLARADGHEVLIETPMEPFDYPNNDPGPHTLLTSATKAENRKRLDWVLSRAQGYYGVINYEGAKFVTASEALTAVIDAVTGMGLDVVYDGSAARSNVAQAAQATSARYAIADRLVDSTPNAQAIDEELLRLEALSLERGASMGVGFAYPVTIEQIRQWVDGLALKGFAIVPASAIGRQSDASKSG